MNIVQEDSRSEMRRVRFGYFIRKSLGSCSVVSGVSELNEIFCKGISF